MKIKYLVITLFSLGLMCASCGKKKKEDPKEPIEQHDDGAAHKGHEDHGHNDHEGHNH